MAESGVFLFFVIRGFLSDRIYGILEVTKRRYHHVIHIS